MNALVFAQALIPATVGHWLIIAIVVAAIIGIAMVVARQAGITIPPFVITIAWIILAVVVGVLAIKFLVGMV